MPGGVTACEHDPGGLPGHSKLHAPEEAEVAVFSFKKIVTSSLY